MPKNLLGKKLEEVWIGTRLKFLQPILQDEIHSEINMLIENSSHQVVLAYIQMIAHPKFKYSHAITHDTATLRDTGSWPVAPVLQKF